MNKVEDDMPQIFKDFLRRRHANNSPAYPEQVKRLSSQDEFYDAVRVDANHKWTRYDGEDPKNAPCVHFQPIVCEISWGKGPESAH